MARRILLACMVLIFTLACATVFAPTETAIPPVSTPSPTPVLPPPTVTVVPEIVPTQDAPLVQIGYFDSVYLRYDPQDWEVFQPAPEPQLNPAGETIEALRHRTVPGCLLHDNLGHGVPPTWEYEKEEREIGGLTYRVDPWTDTTTNSPVLIVYQYPVGDEAAGKRIELVIEQDPEVCIQSAEEVLILSADLISTP